MRVAVVGGGISGLAAGYRLRRAGFDAVVLEAEPRLGGKIHSEHADGWLVEHGPNGYLDSREAMVRLVRDLGLGGRALPADALAERRYLWLRGQLRPLPGSPGNFLASDLLSAGGKLRLLAEGLAPGRAAGKDAQRDESVFDFAARRVGPEAAATLIDPLVTGIYAGDARQTSLAAAFPRLAELERHHGSLTRGLIARALDRRRDAGPRGGPSGPAGRLTTLPGGLGEVIDALRETLGPNARAGQPVVALARDLDGAPWRVTLANGETRPADALVLATPTDVTARLLAPHAPAIAAPLEAIEYAPVAVVALGYRVVDLPRPLDGFGFLVPSSEACDVLGVLWSSTIFPGRAPGGHALLRAIVGGARRPELLGLDDAALTGAVRSALSVCLGGLLPPPTFQRVIRWPRGIPQYTRGHLDRVAAAEAAVASLPRVLLAGNGLHGIGVGECAARAEALVDRWG